MSRSFTEQDSLDFARLSGDYNPIHLDPVAARRMMFGGTILHGMQLALAMVDQCISELNPPLRMTHISADLRRPVRIGESIDFVVRERSGCRVRLEAVCEQTTLMTLAIQFASLATTAFSMPASAPHETQPREWSISELRGCSGRLPLSFEPDLASRLFPNLVWLFPSVQIAVLLAASRLVGIEVPGLHSIWRSFHLSESPDLLKPEMTYRVERIDERFSLVDLRIDGPGLSGSLSTGLRPKPSAQISYDSIRSLVSPAEFASERALVIGGSRGLGEVAVKLLAAGGADVRFTYHVGAVEAHRVSEGIATANGSADCFQYNVLEDAATVPQILADWKPTLLCYFATPFIFSGVQGRFSDELFRKFCDFYVTGFHQTLAGLEDVKRVLYPSSTAIDSPAPNLVEYASAKAAGESLCRSLAAANPQRRFVCPRFARLATDQTATLLRATAADPVQPVLAALRDLMR